MIRLGVPKYIFLNVGHHDSDLYRVNILNLIKYDMQNDTLLCHETFFLFEVLPVKNSVCIHDFHLYYLSTMFGPMVPFL